VIATQSEIGEQLRLIGLRMTPQCPVILVSACTGAYGSAARVSQFHGPEASMRSLEIWEGQGDARPVSWVAFYPYFSAVIFDDLMRDGQSQPGPLRFRREERLKDAIKMLFGDSCAFVFNHHVQDRLIVSDQEPNFLSFWGGLECIVKQVRKGVTNFLAV